MSIEKNGRVHKIYLQIELLSMSKINEVFKRVKKETL
jgi:hypothetical protein